MGSFLPALSRPLIGRHRVFSAVSERVVSASAAATGSNPLEARSSWGEARLQWDQS